MAKTLLTKDAIIAESLLLLDAEGVAGLSMRKLASRLGVHAPTLYYHIPDKSALLNEVVLTLFARCFEQMQPCVTWQDWMREFGRAIWNQHQQTRYAPMLLLTTTLDDVHFERTVQMAQEQLEQFDADQAQLFSLQSAVQAVMTGWAVLTTAARSEKMAELFDYREAALASVDSLVRGCEAKIGS